MEVQPASPDGEPFEESEPRLLYGCRDRVRRDLVATPVLGAGVGRRRIVTGTSYLLRQKTALDPDELRPICRRLRLRVPPASLEMCISDRERLLRAIWQTTGVESAQLDLEVLRQLPDMLRADDGRITLTLWQEGADSVVVEIQPSHVAGRHLGVACDLGTSTVVLKLIDLATGKALALASDYNRQLRSGADVISRIDQTTQPAGLDRLRNQAVTTINTANTRSTLA